MSYQRMLRRGMAFVLPMVSVAVAFLPCVARGQVYVYGRSDFQASSNPVNVIVADFNGDGRPDMAVSDSQNNFVTILIGTANGGFVPNGTYATGGSPTALVAA